MQPTSGRTLCFGALMWFFAATCCAASLSSRALLVQSLAPSAAPSAPSQTPQAVQDAELFVYKTIKLGTPGTDQSSRSSDDIRYWQLPLPTTNPQEFWWLGDHAERGLGGGDATTYSVYVRVNSNYSKYNAANPPVVQRAGYTTVCQLNYFGLYALKTPPGYVAMGSLAAQSAHGNGLSRESDLRAGERVGVIRQDLVIRGAWTDRPWAGSDSNSNCQIWQFDAGSSGGVSPGTFLATGTGNGCSAENLPLDDANCPQPWVFDSSKVMLIDADAAGSS